MNARALAVSAVLLSLALGCSSEPAGTAPNEDGVDSATSGDSSTNPLADSSSTPVDTATSPDSPPATDTTPTDAPPADGFVAAGPHAIAKKDTKVGANAVHLVYPTTAAPAAGFPAVAFAHGFQLKPGDYDKLLGHFASWGYVVVSTDFPGSLFSIDHNDVAKALTAARQAMAAGSIAGLPKVDASRIAASGHSLGGKGSVMAILADTAFVAGLTFDPVDGNPGNPLGGGPDASKPKLNPTEVAKVTVPMGYFGATASHCGSMACAPSGLDAMAFSANTKSPHYLWMVNDFGHMQFLDNPACGFTCSACAAGKAPIDPRRAAIQETAVAFLKRHVEGDKSAQPWLDGDKRDAYVKSSIYWAGSGTPPCP